MNSAQTIDASSEKATPADESEATPKSQADGSATPEERRRRKSGRGDKDRAQRKAARKRARSERAGEEPQERSGKRRRGKSASAETFVEQNETRAGQRSLKQTGGADDQKAARRAARKRRTKAEAASGANPGEPIGAGQSMQPPTGDVLDATPEMAEEELLERTARDDEQDRPGEEPPATAPAADPSKPLSVAVFTKDRAWKRGFLSALQKNLKPSGVESVSRGADLVIDFGLKIESGRIATRGRKTTIVVSGPAADPADVQRLVKIAHSGRALFLPVQPLTRRYSGEIMLDEKGGLSRQGTAIFARAVSEVVRSLPRGRMATPPDDFEETLGLGGDPAEVLKALNWPGTTLPRSFAVSCRRATVEDFLDGKVRFSSKEPPVAFARNLVGAGPLPRSAEHALYSLDFLTQVLTYWFAKANQISSATLTEIDGVLKTRGITASMLLTTVGETLVQLIEKSKKMRESAWEERTAQRRAVAFELFLLCCRMAALRKIRFEQAHCGPVFRGLLRLLERLRPTALPVGSSVAVSQLCVVAALALPLRKTKYGALLLDDAMEWLSAWQLGIGTSDDGVWQEGFAQQGSVLTTLSTLSSDLRQADVPVRPIFSAMIKLARFVDALLAENGACAQIDELPGAAYPQLQKTVRAIQKSAPVANLVKRRDDLREAMLFRDSGYFVSRSSKGNDKPCSHLVMHARPGFQGGPSLSFSIGGKALLIGGGTIDARAAREVRRMSRLDPAAHNAVRIEGQTYAADPSRDKNSVRIDNAWERPLWAAVRTVDSTFDQAQVARTVVHLKPGHALIVVDELQANAGEIQFEEFWHLSPSLQLSGCDGSCAVFASPEGGVLNAAFDGAADAAVREGGHGGIGWTSPRPRVVTANPYIMRERRTGSGLMASFFQWSPAARTFELTAGGASDNWKVTVKTAGSALCLAFAAGELRLVEERERPSQHRS